MPHSPMAHSPMAHSLPNPLIRWGRRLRRRLAGPRLRFVWSGRYVFDALGPQADPRRGEHILTFLLGHGLLSRGDLVWPRTATFEQLARVHHHDYLERVQQPDAIARVLGYRLDERRTDRFIDLQRAMVGGTLLATRTALAEGRIVVNLGGGLHHAHADRGQGFCLFHDGAVAIATFREHGFRGRVLVIDLDLHDGDGTRALFADDPTVHTFSIHNRPWADPETIAAAREDTSVALGSGVEDAAFLAALDEHLPSVVERFQPDLVLYLAGTDPAADDTLGDWRLTADGLLARDQRVMGLLERAGSPPTVILLAGGYGRHAWSYSARFFGWLASGRRLEPPSTEQITLERYRALAGLVDPAELTGGREEDPDDLGLTEEDVLGALAGQPATTRLLGYYSPHGIELALERFGILRTLREKGYGHPTVVLDLDHPGGEAIRIFGEADRRELVGELRVRRDRRSAPPFELLRVEWLMLQDPRAHFSPERTALPGQRHPGLGLLSDVVALLVLICDRLDLDGVVFSPSHYHLAAQSHRLLGFLEPEDQARFDALHEAVEHLPLAEATRRVETRQLVDRATGEAVGWRAAPMVLPVSDRLREALESDEYHRRHRQAREGLEFALAEG